MEDPIPTFSYLVSCIKDLYPKFSYLHVFEPRVSGTDYVEPGSDSNDFLRELWKPLTFISAGGYTRESAMEVADKTGELIAFGRAFLANVRRALYQDVFHNLDIFFSNSPICRGD